MEGWFPPTRPEQSRRGPPTFLFYQACMGFDVAQPTILQCIKSKKTSCSDMPWEVYEDTQGRSTGIRIVLGPPITGTSDSPCHCPQAIEQGDSGASLCTWAADRTAPVEMLAAESEN